MTKSRILVALTLLCALAPSLDAASSTWRARLVADINQGLEYVRGPHPSGLLHHEGLLYYAADAEERRRGIWVTDGTHSGTRLLLLAHHSWSLEPENLIPFQDAIWFQGEAFSNGDRQLWRSDGTAAGTTMIGDPARRLLTNDPMAVAGDLLFFVAGSDTTGYELWRSDGSSEGTLLIADLNPASYGSNPAELTPAGDRLYFAATTPIGRELWITDGSAGGTHVVADLAPGVGDASPRELTMLGSTLFFVSSGYRGSTVAYGEELWRTDGTDAGTRLVSDILPGIPSSNPMIVGTVGGRLLLAATDQAGRALWATDETETLSRLADLEPLGKGTVFGGHLYFSARQNAGPARLWRSDGTVAGTREVAPIEPLHLTASGDKLFFLGVEQNLDTFDPGGELYVTNGTAAGTRRVKDIRPGQAHSSPRWLTDRDGVLYFAADDGVHGVDLWRSDGSDFGTYRVSQGLPTPTKGSVPAMAGTLGDRLLFTATDDLQGRGLWSTDGSTHGTFRIVDLDRTDYGDPTLDRMIFGSAGNHFYFGANDGVHGEELWVTDGTVAGTRMVKDLVPGRGSPFEFSGGSSVAFHGEIYFPVLDYDAGGVMAYRSDGTEGGTGSAGFRWSQIAATDSFLYFTTNGETTVSRIDGSADTPAIAAVEEMEIRFGPAVRDRLFYSVDRALKVISGAGDPELLLEGVILMDVVPAGERIFMFGYNTLHVSDGTTQGTREVATFRGSYNGGTAVGDRIFYYLRSMVNSSIYELWTSDGTAAGTVLVRSYEVMTSGLPGPASFGSAADRLWFTFCNAQNGCELWTSDGTEAGTELAVDLWPGPLSSSPVFLGEVNGKVLISAETRDLGREVWIIEPRQTRRRPVRR